MEGVGEVLAGDQRTWKQNEQGKWYAVGHAVPHQLRAAVIQLKQESEADKAAGRRGARRGSRSRTRPAGRRWVPAKRSGSGTTRPSPSSSLCMSFMIDEPSHR